MKTAKFNDKRFSSSKNGTKSLNSSMSTSMSSIVSSTVASNGVTFQKRINSQNPKNKTIKRSQYIQNQSQNMNNSVNTRTNSMISLAQTQNQQILNNLKEKVVQLSKLNQKNGSNSAMNTSSNKRVWK